MDSRYSKNAYTAFGILMGAYFVMLMCLIFLHKLGICSFQSAMNSLDGFIYSLPMIAFYLVVFIACTAGYANGKYMLKELPISKILNQQLKEKSMAGASIKMKIRAGNQISEEASYLDAVSNVVSSRIPILAVVNQDNKLSGLITGTDLLVILEEILKAGDSNSLELLKNKKVNEIKTSIDKATLANSTDNFNVVLNKMIKNQYTKLVVVDENDTFSGTLDAMDLITEIIEDSE